MREFLHTKLDIARDIGGAKVFAGEDIVPSIPATAAEIVENGRVLLLCDRGTARIASDVAAEMKGGGFRVSAHDIDEDFVPEEQCRLVLGVGAGRVAEKCKSTARELGAECALLLTAPTSEKILSGGGINQVYLDKKVLSSCPRRCYAAGLGILLARPVIEFDRIFDNKVCSAGTTEVEATSVVRDPDPTALAVELLTLGAKDDAFLRSEEGKRSPRPAPCDAVAEVLSRIALQKGKNPRLRGEYMFVTACALKRFYTLFLSSPSIDTLLPADNDAVLSRLVALTGRERAGLLQMFDFSDVNSYFRISYIVGEYRLDFIDRLSAIDLAAAERKWRRTYDDAGFFLRGAVTAREVTEAMSLAGAVSGGLLHYAATTGFLDRVAAIPS